MAGDLIIRKQWINLKLYDLKVLYEQFFTTVEKAIRSELFDFVAHLDNLKVFNFQVDDVDFMMTLV